MNYTVSNPVYIDSGGPALVLSLSPSRPAPYLVDNVYTFALSAVNISGPSLSSVSFYLDYQGVSYFVGSDSSFPFNVSFSTSGLGLTIPSESLITLRAVGASTSGHVGVASVTGLLQSGSFAPTAIILSPSTVTANGPGLLETATAGQVIGLFSSVDPNPTDTFTYSVVTPGAPFTVAGNALVVASGAIFNYNAQNVYTFNVTTVDPAGLNYTQLLSVYLIHVNLPPTAIALAPSVVSESAAVNAMVGTFSVTDRDSSTFSIQLTSSGSGYFYSSGMALYVAKTLSYNAAPVVTIIVKTTDSNSLSYSQSVRVNVTWVNKPPTSISLSSSIVVVSVHAEVGPVCPNADYTLCVWCPAGAANTTGRYRHAVHHGS